MEEIFRVETEIDGKVREQVSEFIHLRKMILKLNKYNDIMFQSKINSTINLYHTG